MLTVYYAILLTVSSHKQNLLTILLLQYCSNYEESMNIDSDDNDNGDGMIQRQDSSFIVCCITSAELGQEWSAPPSALSITYRNTVAVARRERSLVMRNWTVWKNDSIFRSICLHRNELNSHHNSVSQKHRQVIVRTVITYHFLFCRT